MRDNALRPLSICVLLGGATAERPVSLVSGIAVGAALLDRGHSVLFLEPASGIEIASDPEQGTDRLSEHLSGRFSEAEAATETIVRSLHSLAGRKIDVVANLLHGGAGEGGGVQAILELLGIPFVGSGSVASATAMDKVLTKAVLRSLEIPVPDDLLWNPDPPGSNGQDVAAPSSSEIKRLGGYPLVIKPIAEGSTVGISILQGPGEWTEAYKTAEPYLDPQRGLLVERYIPGMEITVGIMEGRALPVVEIRPRTGFYDYARKYTEGETEYIVPAPIPDEIGKKLQEWSQRAFAILGCQDMARVDYRLDPEGMKAACLELNTIPGMTPMSLLPMAAKAIGIEFGEFIESLCRRAAARGVSR